MSTGRRVFVHTFGCQMNVYDSERMVESLRPLGFEETKEPIQADLILLNTCSVREKAEDKARSMLGRYDLLREANPDLLIGIAGCIASRAGKKLFAWGHGLDLVFGPDNIEELPQLVERALEKREKKICSTRAMPRESYRFPKAEPPKDGRVSTYVTVMKGCNKVCAFCVVPRTRGPEVSKPPGDVADEVRRLVDAGVREVTLLGQNVNSYGHDLAAGPSGKGSSFPELLALVNGVEGLERIRFATSHPWDATEELARAFAELDKLCPYLHLPLQSGSDRILEKMRRGYTLAEYEELIARLRHYRPDIALSTDIIVGFPGESEEDFRCTTSALEHIGFGSLFGFKYSVRPGTTAARLKDDVAPEVKQRRLLEVMEIQSRISASWLESFVGCELDVLVEGPSDRAGSPAQVTGRSPGNLVVNIDLDGGKPPSSWTGSTVRARITAARQHSLAAVPA
jgi:tRNA-2-methylthio-N6-dimethylallyladenosine synthase